LAASSGKPHHYIPIRSDFRHTKEHNGLFGAPFLTAFQYWGWRPTAGAAMAAKKNVKFARWHPARHEKDDWLDENAAKHRLLFDSMNF